MGIIYRVTSPSGKIYIGKTVESLERRKSRHIKESLVKDTKFNRAIRKYQDKLYWEVLKENIAEDKLNLEEILAIYIYDSYYEGYNSTLGGEGIIGFSHSIETKRKISLNHVGMLGKFHTEDTKIKMSLSNKHYWKGKKRPEICGIKNPMYGKSVVYRDDVSYDVLCKATVENNFQRNKTANYLNCNRSTIRNRIIKFGFVSWDEFCRSLRGI